MRTTTRNEWRAGMLGCALVFSGLWLGCGDDGKGGGNANAGDASTRTPASCDPIGKSVACTGSGGCAGAQVCQPDGRFGPCDCGGGSGSLGGGAGDGGAGAIVCGAACTRDNECGGGRCIQPLTGAADVEGFGELTFELFPGGLCSQTPLASIDSAQACDPSAEGLAQGCGSCGECVPELLDATTLVTACREKCTPSATDNGCSRDEYTCSFAYGACVEGFCATDDECRVYPKDNDGDGFSDGLVYDADSKERCNLATRRCQVEGKAGAQAGDPCVRNDDCEADGFCVTEDSGEYEIAFKGGYCAKSGCEVAGLECAGDGVCSQPRSWDPSQALGLVCARTCEQGTEPAAAQLGAAGHADGCRAGYMCMWDGIPGDAGGTCMPGNYNAVAANNVGTACDPEMRSAECFSPFGHGRCLRMGSQAANVSFCSILDCGTPGLPENVCGTGNLCVGLRDVSACFKVCTNAGQCAAGLACVPLEGTDAPSVCMFGCSANTECKTGETCNVRTGACASAT